MTTTIAVGFSGVGLAAAGAVAAGAVGLGLLALAGRRRSRSRSPKPYASSGYHKKRRETQRKKATSLNKDSEEKILQRAVTLIRKQDVTGCGMKLVCELAGLNEDELTADQREILKLVDKLPNEDGGGITDYKAALEVGRSLSSCSQTFPLCSLTGTQLMQTIDSYLP
ncbi:hypothetical protein SK128_012585 [Halocaridina rubra]|uniref:Uncharacterized protein n=1 Tax=Halocaridina rubra TaxID=373956 RepID=A0AAN8WRF9_HALRR